jgi:hypothetical protein
MGIQLFCLDYCSCVVRFHFRQIVVLDDFNLGTARFVLCGLNYGEKFIGLALRVSEGES